MNIEDLLSARTVESDRIEFKEGWNPDAIYRSICAFANDFENFGGGYILLGVEEDESTKTAKRPVKGLTTAELADIQVKMIGFNNLLLPAYHPKLFIEDIDGKLILVLWVPGGCHRPYQVPEKVSARDKRYFYYIRRYANSVKVNQHEQQELLSLTNQVPFDDRINQQAKMTDLSMLLVKDYLQKIQSRLAEQVGVISDQELLGQMELISGPNEYTFPRNVGLMMFSNRPDKFFPYTRVEIVEFPDGDAGDFLEQEPITGPVPEQISRTLNFLKDKLVKEKVIKQADKAESIRINSYPYQAIEEILVNSFYHRDYQQREPIEIRIYPNSIIFLNQGGPDRSIRLEAFSQGQARSRRYRNRRLGEFLKELDLTEGRATGIPTILKELKDNGSPAPRFYSDDDRTCFEVELFIHPAFAEKAPLKIDLELVKWDIQGVDHLLSLLLEQVPLDIAGDTAGAVDGDIAGGIAGDIAGDIGEIGKSTDDVAVALLHAIDRDIAGDIAVGIAGGIAEKMIIALKVAHVAIERKELLVALGLVNNVKNFNAYIAPLVAVKWLTMTIPDKPTSPNQKYLTTLKGRMVMQILNKSGFR